MTSQVTDGVRRHAQSPVDPTLPIEPDASVGELLSRVTDDFSQLVRTHVELAKAEIKEEVGKAGKGAGLLTGGAMAATYALLMLSLAAAWGLAEVVDAGWAFLIVGIVWASVATGMALAGKGRLAEVRAVPETKQTVQEDVQWAKEQR